MGSETHTPLHTSSYELSLLYTHGKIPPVPMQIHYKE